MFSLKVVFFHAVVSKPPKRNECHLLVVLGSRSSLVTPHRPIKASGLDRPLSENSSGKTGEEYDDFPMSEAGPSGVCHHSPSVASPRTVNLDESLSARHSPTTVTVRQDLPPRSSPMPLLDDADGHDQYGLSTVRRSH